MSKAKKLKKPLDLPLGKATSQKEVDLSHVRLPIDTSVFGLKHVLTLFETATNEVKSFLAYECDLMYECRVCRTIFRSIANFILHKRKYCKDKYNTPKDPQQQNQDMGGVAIIQRDIETANKIIAETEAPNSDKISRSLNPIIEALKKRQEHQQLVEEIKNAKACQSSKTEEVEKDNFFKSISLEKIEGSNVAVFQTMGFGPESVDADLMKSEVMEIHSIFEQDEAVLDSNGKIIFFNTNENNKNEYLCTECNMRFSTKKTLVYHVKYKHSESRLVYPCPRCKEQLSNAWSVYRHLLKVHRMTTNQIRKCRNQVHNSAICQKLEVIKDKSRNTKENKEGIDDDNEWLASVERDNDLQMCGGCGKHFDRKAALMSHAVMCSKRTAVCNSIKETNNRKKGLELKEKYTTTWAMRSSKRKPTSVILYKKNSFSEEIPTLKNEEAIKEILPISGENKPDIESDEDDWIRKDIQLDKDEVLSIIGLDTVSSNDRSTPSIDKNINDQFSDQNESPSRGFETQVPEHAVNTVNEDLKNLIKNTQDISTLTKTNSTNFENVVGDSSGLKTDLHLKNSDNEEIHLDKKDALSLHPKGNKSKKKMKSKRKRTKDANVIMDKQKSFSEEIHAPENESEKNVGNQCELAMESAVIPPIPRRNKSDVKTSEECTRNIQLLNKNEVLSIIGLDTVASSSVDKNIDFHLSDQNDSPCKGFKSRGIESADNTAIGDLKYRMREPRDASSIIKTYSTRSKTSLAYSCDMKIDFNYESKIQKSDESSACSSRSPSENKMDISSDISLDNKIHCDFKLDLGEDPNFSDVSIKPLIKEIIEEDAATEITKSHQQNENKKDFSHKINGTTEDVETVSEKSVTFVIDHEKSDNNNTVSDMGSCSSNMKKRKRSISPNHQEKLFKLWDPQQFEEKKNDTDYDTFISKIAPFIDIEKLICSLCDSQFLTSSKLIVHMSDHFSWYRYQCSECLFMSFDRNDCKKHVKCHKVPSGHSQGSVLPIPTWKSSVISKSFTHLTSPNNEEETLNKTENLIDSGENLINHLSDVPGGYSSAEVKIVIIDLENENKESGDSEAVVVKKEETILDYVDLTIEDDDERNDIGIADNFESSEGADTVQDLSKQAIMEVILGNTETKSKEFCSQSTEYVRPSRNRTKSIKTCQKDFIYD